MKKLKLQAIYGFSRGISMWQKTLVLMLFGMLLTPTLFAQRTVTGVVKGADGLGVPSASVVVKGTATGSITDIDGNFSVKIADNKAVLVITSVGMTTQEIAVGTQTALNVTMVEDAKTLGEVVVIGYGTSKKKDLTGSVATVNSKDFQKGNIASAEQLIAGKIAGVAITQGTGAPGAGSRIRIRGGSSLSADDPLIVVDGVPLGSAGIGGIANGLALINPNDIESITVLKDASAAAIYGSRASNGVIMVVTKKGKKGEATRINFSSVLSVGTPVEFVPVITGNEFRDFMNSYTLRPNVRDTKDTLFRSNSTQRALLGKASTDWQNLIYRNAFSNDENLSVSGTVAKVLPYRLNLGYLNQNGILLNSNMDRKSVSLNLNPRLLDDHLKVDFSYKGSFAKSKFADEGAIGSAVSFDPTQAPYTSKDAYQGYTEWLDAGIPNGLAGRNPLGLLNSRQDVFNVNRHIANAIIDYKFHFFPDLRANINIAIDQANTDGTTKKDSTAASAFAAKGVNNASTQSRTAKTFESYLNYVKEVGGFRADVMAGYGYQDFYFEGVNNYFNLKGIRQGDTIPSALKPQNQSTLVSFFGRANLGIKNRYLLTLTVRRDGSSKLAPGYKWITYPAAAFAWRMMEDGIGKGLFSDLKLRLGYGITGQQDGIGDYEGYKGYTLGGNTVQYPFGTTYTSTLRPNGFNEQITWQKTATYNFGLDFAAKNDRISGAVDYYFRQTSNLFNDVNVPALANFSNVIKSNVGTLENRGIEVTLNTTPVKVGKFNWDANFILAYNVNKITKLTLTDDPTYLGIETGGISGGVNNQIQLHKVGYSKSSFYVYQQVYNGETGKPIEGVYVDRNGDGKITADDKYLFQKPDANYTLGFTSNLTYDNLSFGFVLRGSIGNYMYSNRNSGGTFASNSLAYLYNPARNVLETGFYNAQYFSDYYVQNASFLKMDNLTLGYNLTSLLKTKFNVQLNAVVQNVLTVTKYDGVDPEIGNGIDNNIYLRPRTYSLGINVNF
jgi:TonB-dependent starch-binding outer membrane protein SusC